MYASLAAWMPAGPGHEMTAPNSSDHSPALGSLVGIIAGCALITFMGLFYLVN